MAAVKSLPVHHHSAGYIYFFWVHCARPGYFENQIPRKPVLGAYAASQTTVLHIKRFDQTEFLSFVILCVFFPKDNPF